MPFKKGQSGNPARMFKKGNPGGGRKKLPGLNELLESVMGEEKDGKSAMEMMFLRLRSDAIKGDKIAAKILIEQAYGRPKEKIEINDKEPIQITVVRRAK